MTGSISNPLAYLILKITSDYTVNTSNYRTWARAFYVLMHSSLTKIVRIPRRQSFVTLFPWTSSRTALSGFEKFEEEPGLGTTELNKQLGLIVSTGTALETRQRRCGKSASSLVASFGKKYTSEESCLPPHKSEKVVPLVHECTISKPLPLLQKPSLSFFKNSATKPKASDELCWAYSINWLCWADACNLLRKR